MNLMPHRLVGFEIEGGKGAQFKTALFLVGRHFPALVLTDRAVLAHRHDVVVGNFDLLDHHFRLLVVCVLPVAPAQRP